MRRVVSPRPASYPRRITVSIGPSDPGRASWPLTTTCSRPSPSVRGASRRASVAHVVEGDVDDRPDVQHHPVPLEAVPARELGPSLSDRVEAPDQDVLELRQRDDVTVVVAHRGQVANLGDGDEALVGGRVPGDAVEEVDLAGSAEGSDLEVLQAPHLEAASDHRVQPAELDVLPEALGIGLRRHPVRPGSVHVGPPEREEVDVGVRTGSPPRGGSSSGGRRCRAGPGPAPPVTRW